MYETSSTISRLDLKKKYPHYNLKKHDFATGPSLFLPVEWIVLTSSRTQKHREYVLDCDWAMACAAEAKTKLISSV